MLGEARTAYEKHDYARAVTLLDGLIGKGVGPSGALELLVRAHIKLNIPAKAVEDYNRLAGHLGKEDHALLR